MKIRWEESVPKFGYLRLHLQDGTTRDATTEDLLRACKASELVVVSAKHVEDMQKLKRECSEPASKADSSRATLCKALDRCSDYEKQAQELRGVLGGDPAGGGEWSRPSRARNAMRSPTTHRRFDGR
jgi:hypothetical protein